MAISTYLHDIWSATHFGDPQLTGYAEATLCKDTRAGVQALANLMLAMLLCIAAISFALAVNPLVLYTCLVLAVLSLHIGISARFVKDIQSLHALGMVLLIVAALSIATLAHRSGVLSIGMMAAVVMLVVAVPLVPWALRETTIVVGLTYILLTLSLHSVPGRFTAGSLLIFQLLTGGAAIVVAVVTARNTRIRKHDIRARFELEQAHNTMQLLSMQDHLTGAWNRRYLDEHFSEFANGCLRQKQRVYLAVIDIDDFKSVNDEFGHQVGDRVLVVVAKTFIRLLGEHGRLVRLGGDEFLVAYCGDELDAIVNTAISQMQRDAVVAELTGHHTVTLSAGFATTEPGQLADLDTLYRSADQALYAAKQQRTSAPLAVGHLTHTGTWKL